MEEYLDEYVKVETLKEGVTYIDSSSDWDRQFMVLVTQDNESQTIPKTIYDYQKNNKKVDRNLQLLQNKYMDTRINKFYMDEFNFPYFNLYHTDFHILLGNTFNSRREVSQIDTERSKILTKDMIHRFSHKFILYSIITYNKSYISGNSIYLYIIYSDISKEISISFLKDKRKVIGTSAVDINTYDHKINDIYYNDLFKYHRIRFRVNFQYQDIKKNNI